MGLLFSNVSPQLKAIFQEQSTKPLSLRQGQVILGKIKEILPNNVAVVQMGKHQVTASLEIPIMADQSYLFEVISLGEMPQLKVLSQSNRTGSIAEQIEQVLANLNINPSKEQLQFVNDLITNQIPLRQADLKQALALYKNDQTPATKEQLMGMLKSQLPITETTLQAIKAINTEQSLHSQLESLYQVLESQPADNETTQQLLAKLRVMLNKGSTQQVASSVNNEQIEQVTQLIQNESTSQMKLESLLNPNDSDQAAKTTVNPESIANQLSKQIGLSERQIHQLNKTMTLVENQQSEITTRTVDHLHSLLTDKTVGHKIAQQLPTQAAEALESFIQQPSATQLTEFIQPLKELIDLQLPRENQGQVYNLLGEMNQTESTLFPVKDQFLIHFKNYLSNAGLDFEHQLSQEGQNVSEQQESLKQLLLQALADQTGYAREAEQIVNLLTGRQLTLLNEDASFLHLSTTIPNMLGMEEDIEVEFYSRKDKDEKIDADYCRIAFYLEFDQLNTTIIDMNVQNRLIQLTIFNDHDISEQVEQYKPLLKEGLEKFNYTLSTLSHKPLPDNHQRFGLKQESKQPSFQMSQLDVRI